MKLYDFQNRCVDDLITGFKTEKTQCLSWYTGSGKTNIFIEFCDRLIKNNPKVKIGISAYLTTEIRDQVFERIRQLGLVEKSHMVVSGSLKYLPKKNITVFNPQAMVKDIPNVKFDYFIVDESHAGMDDACIMLKTIMQKTCTRNTRVLLVSATPWDILGLKRFKNAKLYKRSLDQGLHDGLVTNASFFAEEAQVTFTPEDFNRLGDLNKNAATRSMAVLKSSCIGKMEHLIQVYNEELGSKVLVICPPGNLSEIAHELAQRFNGLPFLQAGGGRTRGSESWENTEENLNRFMTDPRIRFLFVVNKCQVGFDFKELNSVVDLTMSRNIKVLAQRFGRITRKNGLKKKSYFYVYDKSMMKDRLEWLVATMVDFCLGHYDGWTTKSAKYRPISINKNFGLKYPISTTLAEVISALRDDEIRNKKTLSFVSHERPTKWTLDKAIDAASSFASRTEMWSKRPSLYKWFRLNAKAEMDKIFPLKIQLGKWNEARVIEVMKLCKSRKEFYNKYPGADDWMFSHGKTSLRDVHLPPSRYPAWTIERADAALSKIRSWNEVRQTGFRSWMRVNGGERYWKQRWMGMNPLKAKKTKKAA